MNCCVMKRFFLQPWVRIALNVIMGKKKLSSFWNNYPSYEINVLNKWVKYQMI